MECFTCFLPAVMRVRGGPSLPWRSFCDKHGKQALKRAGIMLGEMELLPNETLKNRTAREWAAILREEWEPEERLTLEGRMALANCIEQLDQRRNEMPMAKGKEGMSLAQIYELKQEAQQKIVQAISEFEKATELEVTDIEFIRNIGGITHVDLEVKIW